MKQWRGKQLLNHSPFINPKFVQIFGYTQDELISSRLFSDVLAEDSRELVEENIQRCLRGELNSILASFRGRRRDGVLIDMETNGTRTEFEGRPAIIGTLIDITERKQMEEELIRAQKLESIGVLAGGIAHDFNNLLTGILGNISLAKMLTKKEDKVFERLDEAEKASERARDLTQQLLTFSKGGKPLKKTVSVGQIVRDSARFALGGSNAKCEFSIADDVWPVDVEEGQMGQVVNNLVINDQAMPERGVIRIDPGAKGIVSSGYPHDAVISNFREFGFSGVVAKPYKMKELGRALHEVITGGKG